MSKGLFEVYPELLIFWDYSKNIIEPRNISINSKGKAWWICEKGHSHESIIKNRVKSHLKGNMGCPYCIGRKIATDNSLAHANSKLTEEWHPTRNGDLTAYNVTPFANRKVWWLCSEGHEWCSLISSRSRGRGCPYCTGLLVLKENSLAILEPELMRQWDYDKNTDLNPETIPCGSEKKAWWKCAMEHSWLANINSRVRGNGCPYCSGLKASPEYNFKVKNSHLLDLWDEERNNGISPEDYTPHSTKEVYWKCQKGHVWKESFSYITRGRRCPYCVGKRVNADNCLATLRPDLLEEWDYTKNDKLTPYTVTSGSGKKVYWLCSKGHSWNTTVSSRTSKRSGCPTCASETQTSYPEQILLFYLSKIFKDIKNRYKIEHNNKQFEVDLYIPSINLAVEYDGLFTHKNKKEIDEFKNKFIFDKGISLIRVREEGLPQLETHDCFILNYTPDREYLNIKKIIIDILQVINSKYKLNKRTKKSISDIYIDINKDRIAIQSQFITYEKKNSLALLYPDIALEWDSIKNGLLKPENIAAHSHKRAFWICKNCNFEWESIIKNRTQLGRGCKQCSKQKHSGEKRLKILYPELIKEIHPTKNLHMDLETITYGSNKKANWICDKGHEWEAPIRSRIKKDGKIMGCKKCYAESRKYSLDNE